MDAKIYKINNVEFVLEELTVDDIETILSLLGALNIDTSFIQAKSSDSLVIGDIISGLVGVVGEAGKNGIIKKLLAIALVKKDTKEKEGHQFFGKAKHSEVMEVLEDFFTGEGSSIVTGIKNLLNSIFGKLKQPKTTTD